MIRTTSKHGCGAVAALVAAGLASSAAAQTYDNVEPRIRLPEVTVIGSKEEALALPGSGQFLDTEDIREQTYDDVGRVLRRVPGVYIREEDGYGLFPNISLRGVDTSRSSKVTIMEDGVPSSPAIYSAPEAYYRPTVGRMSGLEVLKGSSQIRYGPHTTGGVINYLSTPIPGPAEGYLKTIYGHDNEFRAHAYYGQTVPTDAGAFGYLVEGFFRRTDGFKTIDATPDFHRTDDTGFTLVEPMIKLSWEPNTRRYQHFEFKYGRTALDADETYVGLTEADFAADPFRRYSGTRFDNISTRHDRFYLRHFMEITDYLDTTATIYYNRFWRSWYKLDRVDGINPAVALAAGGAPLATLRGEGPGTLRVRDNNRSYYVKGAEYSGNYRFATGDVGHELTAGVRYHYDGVRRNQRDDTFTQAANGTIVAISPGPQGGAGNLIEHSAAVAVFVQDAISFDRLTVTPGVRFEYIKQEFENVTTGVKQSDNLSFFAPGIGATYDLNDNWTAFGGVFRGVSPPSPSGTINRNLTEETAIAAEVGARYNSPERGLRGELTLFRSQFRDLIVVGNIGGAGTGIDENAGDVISQGVELSLGYDPSVPLGWQFRMPSFVTFTYTDARFDGPGLSTNPESLFSGAADGNRLPYIPEFTVTVGTGLEFTNWGFAVSGTYVPETFTTASNVRAQIDVAGNPDARFGKTDEHFILDVSAYYNLTDSVKLVAGVHNLLDQEYVAARHPIGPRPGQPLFAYGGLEVKF